MKDRKAFSMVEIVMAILILAAVVYPVFNVLSGSAKMQTLSTYRTYAAFVAHSVAESMASSAKTMPLTQVPSLPGFVPVLAKDSQTSPWFLHFDGKTQGISEKEWPDLHKVLKTFTIQATHRGVGGTGTPPLLHQAKVEVRYEPPGFTQKTFVLHTVLDNVQERNP